MVLFVQQDLFADLGPRTETFGVFLEELGGQEIECPFSQCLLKILVDLGRLH